MLHLYLGTDREKARSKMGAEVGKVKGTEIVRMYGTKKGAIW